MIKNVLIGFFICFPLFAYNQNYLADTASLDFARSLYLAGEYEECEVALNPHISKSKNDSIYVLYLKLLCAQKRYTSALNLDLPLDFKLKNAELFKHTLSVYLDSFQYINNLVFLNPDLKAYLYLKEFDTSEVRFLLNTKHLDDSLFITEQLIKMAEFKVYNNWPFYSAFLLPGSGKMLLGNNRDGLITMFSFGTYTFLAGRAFDRYGISSIFGWVNSALALGFYGANIVGTKNEINRQKKYRQQQINEIVNERIESFMFAIPH
jgi:TM2 domain-containing membrane protein YozV